MVRWRDSARLTMFADNLVPHVLRLDGVLDGRARGWWRGSSRGELIDAWLAGGGGAAGRVRSTAVERIVTARNGDAGHAPTAGPVTAAAVDQLLWERGQGAELQGRPAAAQPLYGVLDAGAGGRSGAAAAAQ